MKTSLETHPPSLSPPLSPLSGRPNQATSESYRAQAQEADITLTTREGDKITISQSSMSQQRLAESIANGSYRLLEQSVTASGMSIAVQGDLNDQEVADLTSLLNDLSSIATDFFNGNMQGAVTGAMNIGNMGSISKLEATFSQTSLLSSYLNVPHPIPSFVGLQSGLDLDTPPSVPDMPTGQSMTDLLGSQWQQFLDALNHQDTRPATGDTSRPWGVPGHHDLHPLGDNRHHQSKPPATSAAGTGQQMVDRCKETMNTHPRLTPLMPSVADLAINQAKGQFGQSLSANHLANAISTAFLKGFNDWLF